MTECQWGIVVLLIAFGSVLWVAVSAIVGKGRLQEEVYGLKRRVEKEEEKPSSPQHEEG